MSLQLRDKLHTFSQAYGIALDSTQLEKLATLDSLLSQWNRAVGLDSFSGEDERCDRYFLEPLYASRWARPSGRAIDLGSGGGSPALPLAIALRGTEWTLVEPHRRKAFFLEEAIAQLGVRGRVLRQRFEDMESPTQVNLVTSRGLAQAQTALDRIATWLAPDAHVLLFTGRRKAETIAVPRSLERMESVSLEPRGVSRLLVLGLSPSSSPRPSVSG